ncbi:MAG TPA: hypothetical protein ENK44_05100 [Caldithrix abyssi]|uniref:Uncharacterized protein n=1 Tax=Caldithrix abyssi TaxID=187145 RepID=A0A7V4TZ42_CALAY|nr:hypothetical protein [Caldithrix abyssi]
MMQKLKKFYHFIDSLFRSKATDLLEWEVSELEHIFTLLVLGNFIGMPLPTWHIALELLPYMEEPLTELLQKEQLSAAPLSELFSNLDIG